MQDTPFKIYNASAGSGKTYTLTKEYLKIILSSNNSFRQILAITFTNKAVNEMKNRILGSLFDFSLKTSLENPSDLFLDIVKELQIDAKLLRNKSKLVLKEILHNYAFFDVSTIDKFTHRLIRTFAKDLKLPQNFEVVLDTDLLLNEAVAKLINKAGNDPKLTKVLIDFALEKIEEDKSWDIAIDLNKIGKLLFNETNALHLKKLAHTDIDAFLVLQKNIQEKISVLKIEMVAHATEALNLIDTNGLQFTDFTASYFPKFMLKIQDGDSAIDFKSAWKQHFANKPLYNKSCDEAIKALLDGLHPQFTQLFNTIAANFHRLSLMKNVYKNIVPLSVLNAIQQELKAIELERDQLSISEFNTLISNEIKDQPAPFIYERLGEKYRHYFIDEFQDTSEMQWNNLIPLIANALESEDIQGRKGSLFLVGDAKQAIYRWRGGKAEQFLNLVNQETNPFVIPPQTKNLPANYRSHEEIIKFNNDFFTSTSPFLNNEIYLSLFKQGNQQAYNTKKGGAVHLSFIEPNDEEHIDEQYCTTVLKTILEVKEKKYAYKDICILVRGNKEGVLLANFLTQHEIPIISSESLLLKSSSKVRFLIYLLRYQEQPKDLETAYELLSYLSLEKENRHSYIARHLNAIEELLKQDFDFELGRLKQISVYDLMEYAIKKFDLSPNSDAYIMYLMDVVLDVEQKEGTGIQAFLSYWDKKKDRLGITAPENIDAVQIMTVHKAKGLEFPIVIFPYANSNMYKEIEPKLWLPVQKEAFNGFEEVLISKKQEVINYSEIAAELYEEEQYKLELDAFNVLYVALTRAVKGLYIITKKDLSSKGEHKTDYYSGLFIHYLKEKGLWQDNKTSYQFGELTLNDYEDTAEKKEDIRYQYSYKERPSFRILTQSGVLWDTDREDALSKGNLIHFIMGLIETEEDIEKAFDIVNRNGDILTHDIEVLKTTIYQIIQHPQLALYYKKGNLIKNEKDIITKDGRILRPDRIVINENRATIIDYKTGKKDAKYKEQIYAYADALTSMGYQVEHKIIIYINENSTPEFI